MKGIALHPLREESVNVAWEVRIDDLHCVTFAPTAKAARWNAISQAREAGYYQHKEFPRELSVKRSERLDKSFLKEWSGRRCWVPDYVEKTI